MLDYYNIHTDLALEDKERFESDNVEISGVSVEEFWDEENEIRRVFAEGHELFLRLSHDNSDIQILSMGMSDDYLLALEAGSNMVRIGSKLFRG